jgi:hypothetical protein
MQILKGLLTKKEGSMLSIEEFQSAAYKEETMKIHTLVSLALSRHLSSRVERAHRETDDQRWLTEQGVQEALKVLDQLDWFLEKGPLKDYLEQQVLLWNLVEELGLAANLEEAIKHRFGRSWHTRSGLG